MKTPTQPVVMTGADLQPGDTFRGVDDWVRRRARAVTASRTDPWSLRVELDDGGVHYVKRNHRVYIWRAQSGGP